MDKDKLQEILDLHAAFVDRKTNGIRANLRGANLCGANLSRANLRGANLREANLSRANLCGANLREANLSRANLCEANLRRAYLYGANLCGADLRRADLCEADLNGADLRRADLCEADLYGANLREANLSRANLREANLSRAYLYGANLYGADLREADLSGAEGLLDPVVWLREHFQTTDEGIIVYKAIGHTKYQSPANWTLLPGAYLREVVNPVRTCDCACGVNFGTLDWINQYYKCAITEGITKVWECLIEWMDLASVIVPYQTDGKARCERLKLSKIIYTEDDDEGQG